MQTGQTPTAAQITKYGGKIQEKNSRISISDVLGGDRTPAKGEVRSAYIHVPFCFHKCHYCDFYSIVDNRDRQAEFTDRLIAEVNAAAEFVSTPLETIFIGGGTPTLLDAPLWTRLLAAINQCLPLEPAGEFTVEANPETVTNELAANLASGGVNRVSIGCQSFNPTHLKSLERWHDPANVHRSVEILRRAGIHNINLDLIFAIPGQTLDEWVADLDEALSLHPKHLSCYGLVYEPNTPLTVKMKSGAIAPCDQDMEAQMYRAARQRLTEAGFEHYEISNWAMRAPLQRFNGGGGPPCPPCVPAGTEARSTGTPLPAIQYNSSKSQFRCGEIQVSHRCRHNMIYWTNRNWWALGPSASGHVNATRWKNVPRLSEYLEHGPLPPIVDVERVDEDARIGEEFMLGLRVIEGMAIDRVEALLSRGQRGAHRRAIINRSIASGLLERTAARLRFRADGLMLADSVLSELI